jgi:hypothetical protein
MKDYENGKTLSELGFKLNEKISIKKRDIPKINKVNLLDENY